MISLKKDLKHGLVSLRVTLSDDLWYLSHIISPGDRLTAKTERKIRIGDERSTKTVRKTLTLTIVVESLTLEDDSLRVKGLVDIPKDDIPKGSHHSISLGLQDTCTLVKSSWPRFLVEKLNDALNNDPHLVLVCLFDRDHAIFSKASHTGVEHLAEIRIDVAKKQYTTSSSSGFSVITEQLMHYENSIHPQTIVLAGPAFWKESVLQKLSSEMKKKAVFIPWTSVSRSSVGSLLSHTELKQRLSNHRLQQEQSFIDLVLKELSHDNLSYGFDDVLSAANSGAVEQVGVSENFLKSSREKEDFAKVDNLLSLIDKSQGRIHFVSALDLQRTLDGLGGIVAVLRWK